MDLPKLDKARRGEPDALWVLIPTHNDWDALSLLLDSLRQAFERDGITARVLIVDDGSTQVAPDLRGVERGPITTLEILRLRRNLGHQRAIAVGLCHLVEERSGRGVVIMDGDGEDRPDDVARLLAEAERTKGNAVFAARLRRSEGIAFTLFYHLYRALHRLLTGLSVRVGNFSYLPWTRVTRLVICSELWSHYAAAVVQSRTPISTVPCNRGRRLTGHSRMNTVALVSHGLSAMAVFADRIGVRALAASGVALLVALVALGSVLVIRWGTALALPGWATTAAGLLVVIVAQIVMLSTLFTFVVLSGRSQTAAIPLRDYRFFVLDESQA